MEPLGQDIRVIALGNPLRHDDGVGLEALNRIKQQDWPACVRFIDGGTCGVDLLGLLEGATRVIIIDAVDMRQQPGRFARFCPQDVVLPDREVRGLSVHQAGLAEVLALGEALDILPPIILYGVQPERTDEGIGLSLSVSQALSSLVEAVSSELERLQSPSPDEG